jgi:hypothetical protein
MMNFISINEAIVVDKAASKMMEENVKKGQRNKNPNDKKELNQLSRGIKPHINEIKNETFKSHIENLSY